VYDSATMLTANLTGRDRADLQPYRACDTPERFGRSAMPAAQQAARTQPQLFSAPDHPDVARGRGHGHTEDQLIALGVPA